MSDLCPSCGFTHGPGTTRAIGIFRPEGPLGHRAAYEGAPLRETREEARRDMCLERQRMHGSLGQQALDLSMVAA